MRSPDPAALNRKSGGTMKKLIAVALLFSVNAHADNYFYVEAGQYKNAGSNDWVGEFPTRFALGYAIEHEHLYIKAEAMHVSNINRGWPFNKKPETYMDGVGVTVGFKFGVTK